MINTETAQVIHTTVADQSARYPISFKYDVLPDTLAPELLVTLDGNPLTYGTDYTVDAAGLQLVNAPEANKTLVIKRDVAFTQEIDFQTGLIDPDQIEDGLDRSVMRDQELKQNALDVAAALAAETEERTTADALLQDAIDTKQDIIPDLATIRNGATAGAFAVQPEDLATVATTGSYNDLNNRPVIPTVGEGLVTIKQGGVVKASFSVNQNSDTEVELEQGGGGTIDTNKVVNVDVLPTADASSEGKYYLYTGATTAEYTQNYIYKNVKTTTYTGEVYFAWLDTMAIDCSAANFANFISSEIGVDPTLVTQGAMIYRDTSSWELLARNSDGDLLGSVTKPQQDYESSGFTFTGEGVLTDGDTESFDCTITEDTVSYAWTRVDVQPCGDCVLKTGDTMTGALQFIKEGWSGAVGGSGNGVTFYRVSVEGNLVAVGYWSMTGITPSSSDQRKNLGSPLARWLTAYVDKLNHGADIDIPTTGGTMVVATPPTSNGTYVLKATVVDGVVTTTWVAE